MYNFVQRPHCTQQHSNMLLGNLQQRFVQEPHSFEVGIHNICTIISNHFNMSSATGQLKFRMRLWPVSLNFRIPTWIIWARKISWESGVSFNGKVSSYQYRKSNCVNKTVIWSSYLHNGNFPVDKMLSWIPILERQHFYSETGHWSLWESLQKQHIILANRSPYSINAHVFIRMGITTDKIRPILPNEGNSYANNTRSLYRKGQWPHWVKVIANEYAIPHDAYKHQSLHRTS